MNLSNRKYVIFSIFLTIGLIFIVRLFSMQVSNDFYEVEAARKTQSERTVYPNRGLIYDRYGKLMVANKAVYNLMVVPKDVKDIDTLAFCEIFNITYADFTAGIKKARSWPNKPYKQSEFISQISSKEIAGFREQAFRYPGFFVESRTLRDYPSSAGSLVLGDVGKISPKELATDDYYEGRDYIGKGGLEKTYDAALRGERGTKIVLVDILNKENEKFQGGKYDEPALSGQDLISTLDSELQAYGEKLMQGKKGSIVAIEPSSGEILALVSAPSYDPNLLVGRHRGANYRKLEIDSLSPLYNRATMGQYRPGSIFKMVQALVAMQRGTITPHTRFRCNRGIIGCHGAHTNDDLKNAIIHSCNPYFWNVMKRMVQAGEDGNIFADSRIGLKKWTDAMAKFGIGRRLDVDIPGGMNGRLPGVNYYDAIYGEKRWAYSTIYSISIGEGEVEITPLHMANFAAIIANRGHFYTPHLVKSIGQNGGKPAEYLRKNDTGVDSKYFEIVREAMQEVVENPTGTARRARIPGTEVCGKTGTVENGDYPDHSVFMAFAPKDNPKIAIACYVEYAGYGGTWAAPICSLMMESYLNDSIANPAKEQRILDAKFLDY